MGTFTFSDLIDVLAGFYGGMECPRGNRVICFEVVGRVRDLFPTSNASKFVLFQTPLFNVLHVPFINSGTLMVNLQQSSAIRNTLMEG